MPENPPLPAGYTEDKIEETPALPEGYTADLQSSKKKALSEPTGTPSSTGTPPTSPSKSPLKFDISDNAQAVQFGQQLKENVQQLKPKTPAMTSKETEGIGKTLMAKVGAGLPAEPQPSPEKKQEENYQIELGNIYEQARKTQNDIQVLQERGDAAGVQQLQAQYEQLHQQSQDLLKKYPKALEMINQQKYADDLYSGKTGVALEFGAQFGNAVLEGTKKLIEFAPRTAANITGNEQSAGQYAADAIDEFFNNRKFLVSTDQFQKADGDLNWNRIVPAIGQTAGTMLTLLGGGKAIGGSNASLFASSYMMTRNDYFDLAKEKGFTQAQSNAIADGSALLTSALELISPNPAIFTPEVKRQLLEEYAIQLAKSPKASFSNTLKTLATKEVIPENIQELAQNMGDKIVQAGADYITGTDKFDPQLLDKNEIMSTVALTTLTTGLISGTGVIAQNKAARAQAIYELSKDLPRTTQVLEQQVNDGTITEQDAKAVMNVVQKGAEAAAKVPDTITEDKKADATELVAEKTAIEQSIEGKDEALITPQKTRIEEINKELTRIATEPSKETKPEDSLQPEVPKETKTSEPVILENGGKLKQEADSVGVGDVVYLEDFKKNQDYSYEYQGEFFDRKKTLFKDKQGNIWFDVTQNPKVQVIASKIAELFTNAVSPVRLTNKNKGFLGKRVFASKEINAKESTYLDYLTDHLMLEKVLSDSDRDNPSNAIVSSGKNKGGIVYKFFDLGNANLEDDTISGIGNNMVEFGQFGFDRAFNAAERNGISNEVFSNKMVEKLDALKKKLNDPNFISELKATNKLISNKKNNIDIDNVIEKTNNKIDTLKNYFSKSDMERVLEKEEYQIRKKGQGAYGASKEYVEETVRKLKNDPKSYFENIANQPPNKYNHSEIQTAKRILDKLEQSLKETPKAETKNNEQETSESSAGLQQRQREGEVKTEVTNDSKNITGLSGEVGKGKEPVKTEPVESPSPQETGDSGIFQTSQEITPEEEQLIHDEFDKIEGDIKNIAKQKNIPLTEDEIGDLGTFYAASKELTPETTPEEILDFYTANKGKFEKEYGKDETKAKGNKEALLMAQEDTGGEKPPVVESKKQPDETATTKTGESDITPSDKAAAGQPIEKEQPAEQLSKEEKDNLQKIEQETGDNFRLVQNTYTKYGEGKPLSEITAEDYQQAKAEREGEKAKEEKDIEEEEQGRRLRKHYKTIRDNATVQQDYKSFLDENKYAYDKFPNAELLKLAQDYINEHGTQKSVESVKSGEIEDGRVGIGVGYLLFKGLHEELGKAIKAGDEASADVLMNDMDGLTEALAKKGTDAGQQVQAFSLFTMMFENPVTTEYYYRKKTTKGNQKAKANKTNKKNAGDKAKKINKAVKKYVKEWAEQIEKDMGGKPKRSRLSDLFKPDQQDKTNITEGRKEFQGGLNDVTRLATLLADPKFRKYAKSVLKSVAYDTVQFAEEMVATLGENAKKYLTELYNVGKEELDKEVNAKQKVSQLEAKIKKRQKEISKKLIEGVEVKENPDAIWGKYKQSAVNSIVQAGEQRIAAAAGEITPLQDFITQLAKNAKGFIKETDKKSFPSGQDPAAVLVHIIKNEEKYSDLLAETILKVQEKYKGDPKKLVELDAYFGQLFDQPFSPQTLSAVVKGELEAISTGIGQVAKRYYSEISETGQKVEDSIQERLMQKFGFDEETAGDIAKQVEKRYKEMVSERIAKDLKGDIDRAIKNAQKTGEKIKPVDMLDRLVSAAMLGQLNADTVMDIFKHKYGVTTFTKEDSAFIAAQVERISKTGDQWRKAEETAKVINYMAQKSPVYMADVIHNLWYASVLSSAVLPIGTGEVNIGFNTLQILNSATESLPVIVMQKIRQRDNPENIFKATLGVWFNSLSQAISQTRRKGTDVERAVKIFSKNFLNESGTNFLTTLMYGSDSFTNFERPLEQTVMTETEFKNLVKKSEEGDSKATKMLRDNVVKMMGFVNSTKYVGRMLAAQDMFFQGIIKNMWLTPVAKEKFYNEGLRGEQLNEAVKNALYNTENEVENAQVEALNDVIEFDYEVKPNGDKFDVYRLGKKAKSFDTQGEANIYIANDAPKSNRYRRAVLEKLNKKEASDIIQRAAKIAQNYVGTNVPTGGFGWVYNGILRAKGGVDEVSKKISAAGRAQNNVVKAGVYHGTAYVVKNANLIMPFVKVPMNIAKLISDYGPLGAVRGYRGGDVFNIYQDENRTQVEKDILYSRAMIGASIFIPFFVGILQEMFDDDDDRDYEIKKEILDQYEKLTGKKAEADNPIFLLPKKGDICGALSFLSPEQKKFLEESGLAKEYCEYDGKSWVTILNKPKKFSLIFPATMNYYRRYVMDNPYFEGKAENKQGSWGRAAASAVMAYSDAFLDISTMKGLASVSYKRTPEQRLISAAENILAPFKQIGNSAIERNIIKYWDGQARHWVDPTEDPKGYAETYIPFYGAYAAIKNAPAKYGMLGEPIHQLPSEQQGLWTPYISQARFWESNKPQRDMYAFLHINGYMKDRQFPIKSYLNTEGKLVNITKAEMENLQKVSGEQILRMLQTVEPDLQKIGNIGQSEFIKAVDVIVDKAFEQSFDAFLSQKRFTDPKKKEKTDVELNKKDNAEDALYDIKDKLGFFDE